MFFLRGKVSVPSGLTRIDRSSPDVFASSRRPLAFQYLTVVGGLPALKMSDEHVNEVENTTCERKDPRSCFVQAYPPLPPPCCLFALLCQIRPSVFLRKPLKDTQICRLSKSKNRSKNKAVAPQSERASQWARRVSHPQTQDIRVKRNPDRLQLTQTHMHTHTHHGALTGFLLWMENSSQRALGLRVR